MTGVSDKYLSLSAKNEQAPSLTYFLGMNPEMNLRIVGRFGKNLVKTLYNNICKSPDCFHH